MKKVLFIFCLIFLLAGCNPQSSSISDSSTSKKGDISKPVCEEFDADFVYSVIKIPIKELVPSALGPEQGCHYQTKTIVADQKSEFVAIYFENLSVENNKKGQELMERTITTDSSISMDHYIAWQENDIVNSVYLIINPNRFVRIDRSSTKVVSNEQIIELAARVADKLNGRLKMNIEKNPIDIAAEKTKSLGDSQESVARNFFDLLGQQKFQDAVNLMDANQQTKNMWLTNFQTLSKVQIKKVEEAFKDEWTPTRQVFKFTLDISVNSQGEQYGWNNGENYRWVTLQKTGDNWQVHELANNP